MTRRGRRKKKKSSTSKLNPTAEIKNTEYTRGKKCWRPGSERRELFCFAILVIVLAIGLATLGPHLSTSNDFISSWGFRTNLSDSLEDQEKAKEEMKEVRSDEVVQLPSYSDCPELQDWLNLNERGVQGYHVLCIKNHVHENRKMKLEYMIFTEGINVSDGITYDFEGSARKFRALMEEQLSLRYTDEKRLAEVEASKRRNKWRFFNTYGEVLSPVRDYSRFIGVVLVFEGGQFIWPGIEIGYIRTVAVGEEVYELETVALTPLLLSVRGFLTEEECDGIRKASLPKLQQSTVAHMSSTSGDSRKWRTSTNTFLRGQEFTPLHYINDKIANLTRTQLYQQEALQVLNYKKGQKYDSHWDYFDPKHYRGTPTEKTIQGGKNRMLTVLWYLSSVSDGGQTVFPMANGSPRPPHFKLRNREDCDWQASKGGIKIEAIKGRVVLFYSMLPDGTLDPNSLHGACPVDHETEEKWAANKWIWNKPTAFKI